MTYGGKKHQMAELEAQTAALREKIAELRRSQEPEQVADFELKTANGESIRLSQLFAGKKELFVVHNMGRGCPYCTLWADGFNGVVKHLENRAAFVVSSPDAPEIQTAFAKSRDWQFKMVSTIGTTFAKDLGYQMEDSLRPGVSVFVMGEKGNILRVSDAEFGPGDDYCQLWHMLDLLPKGADGWQPKFAYRG